MHHDITDEADVIETAIMLDQRGTAIASSHARALRGIGVPIYRWMDEEGRRWKEPEDASNTIASLCKLTGSTFAHLIRNLTKADESRAKMKRSILMAVLQEIDASLKIADEEEEKLG